MVGTGRSFFSGGFNIGGGREEMPLTSGIQAQKLHYNLLIILKIFFSVGHSLTRKAAMRESIPVLLVLG